MPKYCSVTLALIDSGPIKVPINSPENPESHEDLSFAFEQSDYQDPEEETPDIKTVEPFYFHQTVAETEPQAMEALVEKVIPYNIIIFNKFDIRCCNFNCNFF